MFWVEPAQPECGKKPLLSRLNPNFGKNYQVEPAQPNFFQKIRVGDYFKSDLLRPWIRALAPLLFPQELHSTTPGLENQPQACKSLVVFAVSSLIIFHSELPAAAEPAHKLIKNPHDTLIVLSTQHLLSRYHPPAPFPGSSNYNCGCCEGVGCLIHVIGPGSTKRPALMNMVSSGPTGSLRKCFPSPKLKTPRGV